MEALVYLIICLFFCLLIFIFTLNKSLLNKPLEIEQVLRLGFTKNIEGIVTCYKKDGLTMVSLPGENCFFLYMNKEPLIVKNQKSLELILEIIQEKM